MEKEKQFYRHDEEIRYSRSMHTGPIGDNWVKGTEQIVEKSEDTIPDGKQTPDSYIFGFEKFITFDKNMIAVNAAKKVALKPKTAYNPLFIYGESGTGKTHLLKAIEDACTKNYPDMSIMYITSEAFCNDVLYALKSGESWELSEIRDLYRNQDVLLIDDLQFLIGKDVTLSELSFTIDAILGGGNQIVFAADRPPKAFNVSAHIKTKLASGLVAELKAPSSSVRQNIIHVKASELGMQLNEDVVEYISSNAGSSIGEIEGALTSILAYTELYRPAVSLETAKEILKDIFGTEQNNSERGPQ
ncbi:MAG: hypothetical protein K6A29_05170 [Lachnospiraceae bacterium]|nr:hypothetical protein [Lachnospiraceae bacterium]